MKTKLFLSLIIVPSFLLLVPNAQAAVSVPSLTGVDIGGTSAGASVSANANVGTQSTTTTTTVNSITTVTTNLPTVSSAAVQTDTDLQAYDAAIVKSDASVGAVSTSDNAVTVSFNRPAKLFGFIPVTAKESVNVVADAQGKETVSVSKSWWSFLASTNFQSDTLSSAIQSKLSSEGTLSTNATLSASAKAKILSDIQASSDAVYTSSTNASY
jgi:hypothetical protein